MTNQNFQIIFTEKADEGLHNLMDKFKLEESLEDFGEKLKNNQPSNIIFIDSLIKNLTLGKISKQDFYNEVEKNFSLNAQTTEEIYKEIEKNILPYLTKSPQETTENPVNPPAPPAKKRGRPSNNTISPSSSISDKYRETL